jgi:hypothetical protein
MTTSKEVPERPVPITIICCIGFIGAPITMALAFLSSPPRVPEWVATYAFFGAFTRLVCMLGLWTMRRWGAFALAVLCLLNLALLIEQGKQLGVVLGLAWYVLELTIAFLYIRRMR